MAWFQSHSAAVKTNFCTDCGTLLDLQLINGRISCYLCSHSITVDELEAKKIVTRKKQKNKELSFGEVEKVDNPSAKMSDGSVLCGRCGHHELYFKTAQLRSADEGQTIFYECCKCAFTWAVNS